MNTFLILCNSSPPKSTKKYNNVINIDIDGKNQNLNIEVSNITHRIIENLNPRYQDLLEIASYIYYSDSSVSRWSEKDYNNLKWVRDFEFIIPVQDIKFWDRNEIKNSLADMLSFLTGDNYRFIFKKSKPKSEQLYLTFEENRNLKEQPDCVSLFSGGLDSLAGSVNLLTGSRQPLLISHRSSPKIDSRQRKLVELLRSRTNNWYLPHLNIWINRKSNRASEQSQRSRAFLFLSIAGVVCLQKDLSDIFMCENGVVSFNLPLSAQSVSSLLSRSTHPKFIHMFSNFINKFGDNNIKIYNPFIYLTRREVAKTMLGTGYEELIQKSISCAHTQLATIVHPHCGTCSQCIDRRFALSDSSLQKFDDITSYEKDIFINELNEGEERTQVESYIRSAIKINKMNDYNFFIEFPELQETLKYFGASIDDTASKIYGLFKRHAVEVIEVSVEKGKEYWSKLINKELPENCLINLLARNTHLNEPMSDYAERIYKLLNKALPIAFQSREPSREKDVQDQIESSLIAASEKLQRENPLLYYSVVQTKPDFSDISNRLFIEVKFIDERKKLNGMITEITSRILIYQEQGAFALFVIYEVGNNIPDKETFYHTFSKYNDIIIKIIK